MITRITKILFLVIFTFKLHSQTNALGFEYSNSVTVTYHPALDFSITDKFTIEAWIKTYGNSVFIFSNQLSSYPYTGYALGLEGGKLNFQFSSDYLSDILEVSQLLNINDNYWHHVAVVYNGNPGASSLKLYVDGLDLITTGLANSLSGSTTNGIAPYLGRNHFNDSYFVGRMDELRVWKEAKCQAEIQALMNCQLVGDEENLLLYYKFNQGVASGNNTGITTLIDSGPLSLNGTLVNFNLTGTSSNWVSSTSNIAGTCQPFSIPVSVTGNSSVSCAGDLITLEATGAQSYTWMPGSFLGSQISDTPTITTNYSITGMTSQNCKVLTHYTQIVDECVSIGNVKSSENTTTIFPNPCQNYFIIKNIDPNSILKIRNVLGEIVYMSEQIASPVKVYLYELPNGLYFIEGYSNNNYFKKVFVKEN